MRKKNVIGGNLDAHRKANKAATLKSDAKTAGAISALREQYKNFRVKQNKDGSVHVGDTRTKKERDSTMNANKQGRQDAKNSKNWVFIEFVICFSYIMLVLMLQCFTVYNCKKIEKY